VLSEPQVRCTRPNFPGLGRGLDLLLPPFLPSREEKEDPRKEKEDSREKKEDSMEENRQTPRNPLLPNEKWPDT